MEVFRVCRYGIALGILCALVCKAQNDLLDGPSDMPEDRPILVGSTVTLKCSVRDGETVETISWQDVTDGGSSIIFFGENKGPNQKYANFNLDSDGTNRWNLVISNVEGEDSGLYACQDQATTESDVAERIVEKSATSIIMAVGGTEVTTVTVTEGIPSNIVCTSLASIPIIDITWMQQKDSMVDDITSAASQTNTSNADLTADSVSTLQYSFSREFNGGMLTCKTSGQQLAESKEDTAVLNVRYPPEVTSVNYANELIICTAEANPEVTSYAIIVNSEVVGPAGCSGSECRFPYIVTEEDTNIRCNATNDLGMDSDFEIVQPGSGDGPNTAAIAGGVIAGIIILAIIIAGLVYWFVVRPKGKGNKNSGGSEMRPVNNGSDSGKPKPVAAPRSSTGNAHDNEEGKKKQANDNPDGLLYAELEHNKKPGRPDSGNNGNNIIRTEEPTQYADVKTFITQPPSPT